MFFLILFVCFAINMHPNSMDDINRVVLWPRKPSELLGNCVHQKFSWLIMPKAIHLLLHSDYNLKGIL